jgi:hypothetical protein
MANGIPELIPMYVEGTMSPANVANIDAAILVIYDNLPKTSLITQATVDAMSKMGDRREKEAKATAKALKGLPNVLFPPLTPARLEDTLTLNDQVYLIQLDLDNLAAHAKKLVDVTGGQGTNWAIFAKHTADILAKSGNDNAKLILEKLNKALKEVEQEMAANKLSKSDKELLKEAKAAKAAEKLKKAE